MIINCLYVYLLDFLCATHLLFLVQFVIQFVISRPSNTARMCV